MLAFSADNQISTLVTAAIDGDGAATATDGISAGSISITATDSSMINAVAAAASIAAGVGGGVGAGVSIGISVAHNVVANQVSAFIANADEGVVTANGTVSIQARSQGETVNDVLLGGMITVANLDDASKEDDSDDDAANLLDATGDRAILNALRTAFTNNGVDLATDTHSNRLRLAAVTEGQRWTLVAPDGKSFTLTLSSDGTRLAVHRNTINAVSAAASLAAGAGGLGGAAFSGAGAFAENVVLSKVRAFADSSRLGTLAGVVGDIDIDARSESAINAMVLAASAAAAAGGLGGIGASIGVADAGNTIGGDIKAYLANTSVRSSGLLSLDAVGKQTIDSVVVAGSAAIAAAGAIGVAASGAGASSVNTVGVTIDASIDGSGLGGVHAQTIALNAQDLSTVTTWTGAASLAASLAGVSGVSLSIGVGLAQNTISTVVTSGIRNAADVSTQADYTTTGSTTPALVAGSRVEVAPGYLTPARTTQSAAALLTTGGRVQLSDTYVAPIFTSADGEEEFTRGSSVTLLAGHTFGGTPIAAGVYRFKPFSDTITLSAQNYGDTTRWGRIGGENDAVYAFKGVTGTVDFGFEDYSDTSRWAKVDGVVGGIYEYVGLAGSVNLGQENYADAFRWTPVAVGGISITADETATIRATAMAASAALSASFGASVSLSGAGADATNIILSKVHATITDSSVATAGNTVLSATNESLIDAQVKALSAAASVGAVASAAAIGSSTAHNFIGWTAAGTPQAAEVKATIVRSRIDVDGMLEQTAEADQTIVAQIAALSAAVAGGLIGGTAASGAGVDVVNKVSSTVEASISGSTSGGGVHAEGDITLRAQDTSTILAAGAASAVSASFGPSSVAIAVGVALGSNQISNTIAAFVDGSTVTTATGGLTLQAIEAATIAATSQMAAVSLSTGLAIAGGGADSNGVVTTATKADVKNSMVTLGGGMTINVQDTSIASAIVETTAVAAGIGFAAAGSTATTTLRPTVAATVSNSTVTAVGDIEIGSDSKIWGSVLAEGNSFGLFAAAGSFATSTLDPTVVATITGGSVTSTGGGILLASRYNTVTDSNGDFLNATTALLPVGLRPASPLPLGGLAEVRASSGGIVAASGGYATAEHFGSTIATAGGTLSAAGGITVSAVSHAVPMAVGGATAGGLVGVGSAIANSFSKTATAAAVTGNVSKASDLSVESIAIEAPRSTTKALSGGLVAGSGSEANATVAASDVGAASAASLGSGTITVSGGIQVASRYRPAAWAVADGGSYGAVGVGASLARTHVAGDVSASVGDNARITAGSLSVSALRELPGDANSVSGFAKATASAGGLIGVTGSDAISTTAGTVTARTGSNVRLPLGDVTVLARSETRQQALAQGKAGGIVAVGSNDSRAESQVDVATVFGANAITDSARTGGLNVQSEGIDFNEATTVAGSGGLIAGSAATATTRDLSTATTTILGNAALLYAGNVLFDASHQSHYAASADSTSASAVGASGANAYATSDTAARTIVSPSVQVRSTGTIAVTSANTFYRIGNGIATVSAAGGGGATATAAGSTTTLGGLSRVTIGDDVKFTVAAAPLSRDGIYVVASTNAKVSDSLDLQAGGALTGAGVDADLTVTATNEVVVGNRGAFTSTGNIGIGTYTDATASTQALASTWGLAAVGVAYAKSHVISTQSVTIGTDNDIFAFGNVDLVTGSDPTSAFQTILQPIAVAQGFISGVIAIPDATADAIVTSNAALTVGVRTRVRSGQNSTLAARRGTLLPTADGTAKGYQLGLIPVTVTDSNPAVLPGVGTVTVNGTVEAGIYNTLDIRIPDSRNAGIFSSTILVAAGGVPFSSEWIPQFVATDFAPRYYDSTQLQSVNAAASSTPVGAWRLGALFAAGGNAIIDADILGGAGSVTAKGTPSITIRNESPDYLIIDDVTIPNLSGGNVLFRGAANGSGFNFVEVNPGTGGTVDIRNTYDGPVGNSSYGPGLFLVSDNPEEGGIQNLGGVITIYSESGSFFQAAGVFGQQVNVSIPKGAVVITLPTGSPWLGGNPYSEWDSYMVWPGGDPAGTSGLDADMAVAYVVNSEWAGFRSSQDALNRELIHYANGTVNPNNRSYVYYGGGAPANPTVLWSYATYSRAIALSPVGQAIAVAGSFSNDARWFPVVPIVPLEKTAASYASADLTGSQRSSAVYGGRVDIVGATIDINTKITAGSPTDWSLELPATITVPARTQKTVVGFSY